MDTMMVMGKEVITREPKATPLPEMLNHVTGTMSRSGVYTVKEEPEVEDVTEM